MLVALGSAALLLSGCAGPAPSTEELTDQGEVSPIKMGWADVESVEKVSLPTVGLLSGTSEPPRAGEIVLINFWASTCAPCRREMPLLEQFSKSGDAEVIGVTRDRFAKFAKEAISAAKVTYPNYQDFLGNYAATFHGVVPLGSIPVSVVVVDGKAERIHLGPFEDMAELRAGLRG
jgi:thiol-disulfide isomerase/thioredoxin